MKTNLGRDGLDGDPSTLNAETETTMLRPGAQRSRYGDADETKEATWLGTTGNVNEKRECGSGTESDAGEEQQSNDGGD